MLIVNSFNDAQACHALNPDILMEVMIPNLEKAEQFGQLGIPWSHVVAFVGHTPPEDAALYAFIHRQGTRCMIGTSRNLDRKVLTGQVTDIRLLESDYRAFLKRGADLIETDIPIELGRLLFALLPAPAAGKGSTIAPSAGLRAEQKEGGILVLEGEKEVFFYQSATKSLEGKYPRANYLHPLYDLDGNVLTEDFPKDHFHHRGIFWAWHQLRADARKAGDSWETRDFAWDVRDVAISTPDEQSLVLKAKVLWISSLQPGGGEPKPLVEETTIITVHRATRENRMIDFHIRLLALEKNLMIGGSEDEKGYGGFSARIRIPRNPRFTGRNGAMEPKVNAVEAGPWMDLSGCFDESDTQNGVAILTHPSLPVFPPPWILRREPGMQNAVYPGRQAVPLPSVKPPELRYRLVIHRGDAGQARIDRLQAEYEREK
jgi:Tfp pilus assembly protein PilZ